MLIAEPSRIKPYLHIELYNSYLAKWWHDAKIYVNYSKGKIG